MPKPYSKPVISKKAVLAVVTAQASPPPVPM